MNQPSPINVNEEDYRSILDLIHRFHLCHNRGDLNACIEHHLLPLLRSQTASWGYLDLDLDLKKPESRRHLGHIGIPEVDLHALQTFTTYGYKVYELLQKKMNPVVVTDMDLARDHLDDSREQMYRDHPHLRQPTLNTIDNMTTALTCCDAPDYHLFFGVSRIHPNEAPYTAREARLMELIYPHLIRTIKSIALEEDLKTHQALIDALSGSNQALALAHPGQPLFYCNALFSRLTGLKAGDLLLPVLADGLEREICLRQSGTPESMGEHASVFLTLEEAPYRADFILLRDRGTEGDPCWLIKLKPAGEPQSRIAFAFNKAGLSPREMEIASHIHDGLSNDEVVARLAISPNTLRNHLKKIYRKLGISSRVQLQARLREL